MGSWLYSEGEGEGKRNVLSFIDARHYIIIHEHNDGETQAAGSAEFGTYELNKEGSRLNISIIADSDRSGGLDDGKMKNSMQLALAGDSLKLTDIDSAGGANFTRVTNTDNPLIGGWSYVDTHSDSERDNINILTFLSDSDYVIVHSNNNESYTDTKQPLSGEFGTYSYSESTQEYGASVTFETASVETDGPGGFINESCTACPEELPVEYLSSGMLKVKTSDTAVFAPLGVVQVELKDPEGDTKTEDISFPTATKAGFVNNKAYVIEIMQPKNDDIEGVYGFETTEKVVEITLQENGAGEIDYFRKRKDGTDDINRLEWKTRSSGALTFTETDLYNDEWDWELTPLAAETNDYLVRIVSPREQEDKADLHFITTLTVQKFKRH